MYFSPVPNIRLFTNTVILPVAPRSQRTPGKMLGDIGKDWTKNSGRRSLPRGAPSTDKVHQGVSQRCKTIKACDRLHQGQRQDDLPKASDHVFLEERPYVYIRWDERRNKGERV